MILGGAAVYRCVHRTILKAALAAEGTAFRDHKLAGYIRGARSGPPFLFVLANIELE
jgi:hypothetical protein